MNVNIITHVCLQFIHEHALLKWFSPPIRTFFIQYCVKKPELLCTKYTNMNEKTEHFHQIFKYILRILHYNSMTIFYHANPISTSVLPATHDFFATISFFNNEENSIEGLHFASECLKIIHVGRYDHDSDVSADPTSRRDHIYDRPRR